MWGRNQEYNKVFKNKLREIKALQKLKEYGYVDMMKCEVCFGFKYVAINSIVIC